MNWLVIALTFLGVNLDFCLILLCLLQRYPTGAVLRGYLMGVILLVTASYLLGHLLTLFLPEWLLGILGILPIWMALHDDDEAAPTHSHQAPSWTVFITYLAVCSGCNLSIFLPILTGVSLTQFGEVLLFVMVFTLLIVGLLAGLGQLPGIKAVMNKYSEPLMKVVYIGVGLYVFWDSGLVSHLLGRG